MNIVTYKYSFILPIYNPGKSLITALKCYQNLSYRNFEIIVVDDSDENILKDGSEKFKYKGNIFSQKKKDGLDAAFNFGINKATGDIIVMTTDDNLPQKFLEILNKIYNENFDVVIEEIKSKIMRIFMLYIKVVMKIMFIIKKIINQNGLRFSAKKKCLVEVGLYPNIGIDGGNDNLLSESLKKI